MNFNRLNRFLVTGLTLLLLLSPPMVFGKDSAIIIFDGSGSMWGQIEGKHKIEIAREVMGTVTKDWNEDIDLGLLVYGHREKSNCEDIELVVPVTSQSSSKVMAAVNAINPKGKTPISTSLRQAAEKLRFTEDSATVILISDGEETCKGDPCVISKELEKEGIDFTAHVIGFDVEKNKLAQEQLRCIAENTGGQFYEAENAAALKEALIEVKQEVEKKVEKPKQTGITLKAVESGSEQVISGESDWTIINLANEDIKTLKSDNGELTVELTNGEYEIFLSTNGQEGEGKITITDGGEQTFQISLKEAESNKPFSLSETLVAGERVDFTWKGPNNDKDLIFIFDPGIAKNRYPSNNERRHRVADGEPARLTVPAKPGKYEVRYYSFDNGAVLSAMDVEVVPSTLKIELPETVSAGKKFDLSWQNAPNSPKDMLFISEKTMDDNRYFHQNRLLANSSAGKGQLTAPAKPGEYEIRYYSYNNGDVLVKAPLVVSEADVSFDAPRMVRVGEKVEIKWTGPDSPGDLIFIAEPDMEEGRYYYSGGRSAKTSDGSPATLTVPAKAGTYEIRYYSKENGKVLSKRALIVR